MNCSLSESKIIQSSNERYRVMLLDLNLTVEKPLIYTWSDTQLTVWGWCQHTAYLTCMQSYHMSWIHSSFVHYFPWFFTHKHCSCLCAGRMTTSKRMLNRKRPLQTTVPINHYNLLHYRLSSASHETCLCDMKSPAGNGATARCRRREMSVEIRTRCLLTLLL